MERYLWIFYEVTQRFFIMSRYIFASGILPAKPQMFSIQLRTSKLFSSAWHVIGHHPSMLKMIPRLSAILEVNFHVDSQAWWPVLWTHRCIFYVFPFEPSSTFPFIFMHAYEKCPLNCGKLIKQFEIGLKTVFLCCSYIFIRDRAFRSGRNSFGIFC